MITKDQYAGVMRWAAISLGSQTLAAAAIGALPFLGVPPLNKVVQYVFAQFLKVLAEDAEFGLFFLYTDFRVTAQGRALFDAALKNYQLKDAGTDEEKAHAKEDLRNKFRSFARLAA